MKRCTACQEMKEESGFNIYHRGPYTCMRSKCKTCEREYYREYAATRHSRITHEAMGRGFITTAVGHVPTGWGYA